MINMQKKVSVTRKFDINNAFGVLEIFTLNKFSF